MAGLEADFQVREQDLAHRGEELQRQSEQRVAAREAACQARTEDLDRRQRDLEQSVQQRLQIIDSEATATRQSLDRREAELEKRHQQRMEALEADYQSRSRDLAQREQTLDARAKEVDAAARIGGRRELVTRMLGLIEQQQKEVHVSPEAEQRRKTIQQVCLPVLGGFGLLMVLVVVRMIFQSAPSWQTILPLIVVTAGFALTLWFYLRSHQQWLAEQARAESTGRKLGADLLRANWIAELFMESRENARVDLPDRLLESFAQGLFVERGPDARSWPTLLRPRGNNSSPQPRSGESL